MECLLCTMWARMPYAKRHTTPTTSQETESALIIGYWMSSRCETVPRVCERHMSILTLLDQQEGQRIEVERLAREEQERMEQFRLQTDQFQQRKRIITTAMQPKEIIAPVIPPSLPVQEPPKPPAEFVLGPGPLTNENTATPPPPLPVVEDPAAPYRGQPGGVESAIAALAPPMTSAKPGTVEGALEAAKMPPVQGAIVTHSCVFCGKEMKTGEVHAC